MASTPYSNYDSRAGRPFLFRGEIDQRLDSAVDHVLAAIIGDSAKAYPFEILREQRVINDSIGDRPIVVFFQSGVASALGDSVIDSARDIGTAGMYEASFDGEVLQFAAKPDGAFTDAQTQSTWNAFGEAIDGGTDRRPAQLGSRLSALLVRLGGVSPGNRCLWLGLNRERSVPL